jgi:hypothetical protein
MTDDTNEPLDGDLADLLASWDGQSPLPAGRDRELLARLGNDSELRRRFAEEIHLAGLARAVQSGEPRWLRIEERLGAAVESPLELEEEVMAALRGRQPGLGLRSGWNRVGQARPWLAAAAGLVIGLFGASVVWAFTNPKAVATASRLFTFVDGGFEKGGGVIASGLPTSFGIWSGDRSEIVSDGAAEAVEGNGVLRFFEAEREPALPAYGAASCDVYQFVDLRSLRSEGAAAETTLELSVRFRDGRAEAGETVKFFARIYLFAGSPESLAAEWPITQKEALASASGGFDSSGGESASWRAVTTKVLMPSQADFAVVHLLVHKPNNPRGAEAAFGEQFADDARLTLKTQPALPVRIAHP